MLVLGIETSCDETAASLVRGGEVLSSVVASQVEIHRRWGGVVPELASRAHLEALAPTVLEALERAGVRPADVEGVAVTRGPGLAGALLVGLVTAKAFAHAVGAPVVGVNHVAAHAYAALATCGAEYPALVLVVSGGHTDLLLAEGPLELRRVGRTVDDAAGEAFDKVAKLLGLGYPGGPAVEKAAEGATAMDSRRLPRFPVASLKAGEGYGFSFSGLKTAVLYHVREHGGVVDGALGDGSATVAELAAAFQDAVVRALVKVTLEAADGLGAAAVYCGGGVACNKVLRARLTDEGAAAGVPVRFAEPWLCTDNAAMVAMLGEQMLEGGMNDGLELDADPSLSVGG